jgi:prophage regulatory protein
MKKGTEFSATSDAKIAELGLLRLSTVLLLIPISRSAWYQGIKDGRFPQPVKLGPRTVAWRWEDIQKLINDGVGQQVNEKSYD